MRTTLFETEEPISRRQASNRRDTRGIAARKLPARAEPRRGREHNKAVKRDRIKAAARELFSELDYEKATVRAIAAQAGVALGTVLRYAEDKRDLILLAYNDDVATMIASGEGLVREHESFDANLLEFFRVFYVSYAANVNLARTYLQINFFTSGMNAKDLAKNRQLKLEAVKKIVRIGQKRDELRRDIKPDLIAMQFLFLHSSAVRTWILADRPSVRVGLAEMRRLIDLQTQGLRLQRRK